MIVITRFSKKFDENFIIINCLIIVIFDKKKWFNKKKIDRKFIIITFYNVIDKDDFNKSDKSGGDKM